MIPPAAVAVKGRRRRRLFRADPPVLGFPLEEWGKTWYNSPIRWGGVPRQSEQKEKLLPVNKHALRAAFPLTIPVMAGYLVLGMGFGILLQSRGYSFLWAGLMSLTIYAGSMEYVAVDLLSGGASLISAALMTLVLNARHLFYGLSMLEKYRPVKGAKKAYLIHGLTDETYSLVCSAQPPEGVEPGAFYFWITLLDQCYWLAGSILGGLLGQVLPFDTAGIDFAMTALFVVIFTDQWLSRKNHLSALIGLGVSAVCLVLFGPDNFLIPAMAGIALLLMLLRRFMGEEAAS